MNKREKIKISVYIIFRVLLGIAFIISIINSQWLNALICVLTLIITYIPPIIEKRFYINYPSEFEISVILFIFASLFLGEINYFYHRFWWWDIFLHSLSGIIVADFGFSLIYTLNRNKKIMTYLSPLFAAIFVFSFSLGIATLWEIFEFSIDQIFDANMQRGSLLDTMIDLLLFTITSGLYSLAGYFYFKNEKKWGKVDLFFTKLFNKSKILVS